MLRRDPQEYDVTDLFNDLSEDALNVEGFLDWASDGFPNIDWDRVKHSYCWMGSVTRQWVEEVCGQHDYMVEEVFDYVVRNAEGTLKMIVEADNYGYMDSEEDAVRTVALINIWRAEGMI